MTHVVDPMGQATRLQPEPYEVHASSSQYAFAAHFYEPHGLRAEFAFAPGGDGEHWAGLAIIDTESPAVVVATMVGDPDRFGPRPTDDASAVAWVQEYIRQYRQFFGV